MGLNNNTTEQAGTKLSIVGGEFTIRVQQGTEGSVSRILTKGKNEGKEVWELRYKSLSNVRLIHGLYIESEYPGIDVIFRDADSGEDYTVNFPLDSGYLYDFIRGLPNIDTSKPFNVEMHESKKKTKDGNPKYNLRVAQHGKLLSDYYVEWKKDAQGKNIPTQLHGIPSPTKDARGWNWRPVEDFLLEQFTKFFSEYSAEVPAYIQTGSDLDGSENGYNRMSTDNLDEEIPF